MTIYHLILEATLGLTTFEFSTRFMEREGLLPATSSPATARSTTTSSATSATGSGFCAEPWLEDPAMGDVVRASLRELLPAVAQSLTPPEGADASVLGASAEEIREFALDGLKRRLDIIGVPLDTLMSDKPRLRRRATAEGARRLRTRVRGLRRHRHQCRTRAGRLAAWA